MIIDADIALDLLQKYKELAFAKDNDGDTALGVLAQKPSAFPSGTTLALWQQWVYSCRYPLVITNLLQKKKNFYIRLI